MKKILLFAFFAFFCEKKISAQTPDWSGKIANIMYTNCTKCHRTNGIAPFSLLTYQDAYAHRFSIQSSVNSGYMPPWPPDPKFSHLAFERVLSAGDKKAINDWISGNAPSGDLTTAPPVPVYSNTGEIAAPDLNLVVPLYNVKTTTDLYRCFAIPTNLLNNQFVTEIEIIPGNRKVVHHVLAFQDTAQSLLRSNGADGQPGYTNFGGTGSANSKLIAAWVPGQGKFSFPKGMGVKLAKNAVIVLQVHYPAGVTNEIDSTKIVFKYAPAGVTLREVFSEPVLNHFTNINAPINIPANTTRSYREKFTLPPPINISLLGVAPHMHLIGRNFKVYATLPGGDTLKMVNVPNWDFHWQGFYGFRNILKIPGGTTFYAEASYDNTTNNPANPNSPPKNVVAGEFTTDEMMIVYAQFLLYQPGDENIVIDASPVISDVKDIARDKLTLSVSPNPVQQQTSVQFTLPTSDAMSIDIFNVSGEWVKSVLQSQNFSAGIHQYFINTADIPSGIYFVRLQSDKFYGIEKLIKM